jgi:CO/xanthine dehydrogenase FAD-binding subunit
MPDLPVGSGCGVSDVAPRRNSRPLATASAIIAVDEKDRVVFARLSVSGCGNIPRRCHQVEEGLLGEDRRRAPDIAFVLLTENPMPRGQGVLDAEYAAMVLPALMRRSVGSACASAQTSRVAQ